MKLTEKQAQRLLRLIGWKRVGEFPKDVKKSIVVMAPHTAYSDAVIGKLILRAFGLPHLLLGKKELFRFPFAPVMRLLGIVPIRGLKNDNSVLKAVRLLKENESMHLVICPEAGFAPTDHWNPGFLAMARRAGVPVVIGFMDYKKREGGFKGIITDIDDSDRVTEILAETYKGVTAKYPDRFMLPKTAAQRRAAIRH